jgi:acyl-CoA dehydrogenase
MTTSSLIADQAERLFRSGFDMALRRMAEHGQWPIELWTKCEEMGLPLLLAPEGAGGHGVGWEEARGLFSLLGEYAIPLPVGETAIAARLLADHSVPIPSGPLTVAVDAHATTAPWGGDAQSVVILGVQELQLVVPDPALTRRARNIGRDPRDEIGKGEVLHRATLLPDAMDNYASMGAGLRICQIAGALRWLRNTCVDYAAVRVQFGKPISRFQAVQHALALLAAETAAAEACARHAAAAIDRGEAALTVSAAKIRSGRAAAKGASLAHQILGAIGFTDEHELHDFTRRLWAWRSEFGNERYHADRLGRAAVAAGDGLWVWMSAL